MDDKVEPVRFYLKQKGGDPRNHEWHEVSETRYDMAIDEEYFKKTDIEDRHAKQRS